MPFMNISTMRRVDRWVGVPACFCLTRLRRLADSLFRRGGSKSPAVQRVAFIKLAEQGATVLAYPALCRAVEMVGASGVLQTTTPAAVAASKSTVS